MRSPMSLMNYCSQCHVSCDTCGATCFAYAILSRALSNNEQLDLEIRRWNRRKDRESESCFVLQTIQAVNSRSVPKFAINKWSNRLRQSNQQSRDDEDIPTQKIREKECLLRCERKVQRCLNVFEAVGWDVCSWRLVLALDS